MSRMTPADASAFADARCGEFLRVRPEDRAQRGKARNELVENFMKVFKQVLVLLLCGLLVQFSAQAESFGPAAQSSDQAPAPQSSQESAPNQTPQQVQQLVAPIALYPDALVAQILAASTYPTQIV